MSEARADSRAEAPARGGAAACGGAAARGGAQARPRAVSASPRDRSAREAARAARLRRALGEQGADSGGYAPPRAPSPGRRPSESTLRALTVAVVAIGAALLTGHAWLLALAAGPLVLLALSAPDSAEPAAEPRVTVEASTRRCFEGERVAVRLTLREASEASEASSEASDAGLRELGWIDPGVYPGPGLELSSVKAVHDDPRRPPHVVLTFTARRWGRWTLGTADLDLHDRGGTLRRTVRVDLGEAEVFPVPADGGLTPVPVRLPERLGEHSTTAHGDGVEVIGVRPHVWGERQRRIHWAATTRRGSIQIQQFAAERAADTVIVLDACVDLLSPAGDRSTLDEALRVASGIARAYLRGHDRVGTVSLGGQLRWLRPGTGDAHFYRIVQSVLDVRRDLSFSVPTLDRLPAPALPPRALVYVVTPLADDRVLDVLRELAERGHPLVVVELAAREPRVEPGEEAEELALRLWRQERRALRFALAERGIPVLAWDPDAASTLDLSLAPLLRVPIRGRSR